MLARLDPRHLERIWFPLGEQTKEETRAEAERAGLAVARRAESQEACFLGGGDYRDFLERHGLNGPRGARRRRDGSRRSGRTRASGASRRASGEGSACRPASPPTRSGAIRRRTPSSSALEPRSRARKVRASGRLFAAVTRSDAKLRYRSPAVAADVEATDDGFRLRLDEPAFGVATGQTAVLYEGDVVVGAGHITGSAP